MIRRTILLALLAAAPGLSADWHKKLWKASIAAVAAGSTLDAASSWNRMEANPMLRGPHGRFGSRAVGIKIGAAAGVLAIQHFASKGKPAPAYRCMALTNFAAAGVFTYAAAHNWRNR